MIKITEEMRHAFYRLTEITSRGTVLNLDEGLRAVIELASRPEADKTNLQATPVTPSGAENG